MMLLFQFEPIIQPESQKNVVHHILVYGCYGNTQFLHNFGTMCYQDQGQYVYEISECSTVLFSWAVGGGVGLSSFFKGAILYYSKAGLFDFFFFKIFLIAEV